MLNNTLFFFTILSSIVSMSQIRVHPIVGGLFLFQNIENKTKQIHHSYRLNRTLPITGIGIEYIHNRTRINLNYMPESWIAYHVSFQMSNFGGYSGSEDIVCLKIGKELKKRVSWIKAPKMKYNGNAFVLEEMQQKTNKYLVNFKIIPYVGIRASKISDTGFQEKNFSFNINSNSPYFQSVGYEYYIPYTIFDKPIIRKKNNLYLTFGTTLQFFSYKRDRLAIHFEYNKGLSTILDTYLVYKKIEDTEWSLKRLYSRGSNIAITASYPITILNKKGERRKDRNL
jgi:hypothetical protein